jgi:hypothetical protein
MIQDNAEFDLSGLDFFKILTWLNPFAVTETHAQAGTLIWVDKSNDWFSGGSYLRAYGSKFGAVYSSTASYLFLYSTTAMPSSSGNLTLNIPSDGFYVVSFEGSLYGSKTLQHYDSSAGWEDVDTTLWGDISGNSLYPVLCNSGLAIMFSS